MDARNMNFPDKSFDVVMILYYGFGLAGTIEDERKMLKDIYRITTDKGLFIGSGIDALKTDNPVHIAYQEFNKKKGKPFGDIAQVTLRLRHREYVGKWYNLLFINPNGLTKLIEGTGWKLSKVIPEKVSGKRSNIFLLNSNVGCRPNKNEIYINLNYLNYLMKTIEKHEGFVKKLDINLLVIIVGFLTLAFLLTSSQQQLQQNTLRVRGSASMQVAPDKVTIWFSVQTESVSASDALRENSRIISNALNSLYLLGIANDSISTVSYNIYIQHHYNDEGVLVNKTYIAVQSMKVELKDQQMQKVGSVIDSIVDSGVNRIDSISFGLKQETEESLKMQLLSKAVEDAKQKAETIASASGTKITGIYEIVENYFYTYYPIYPPYSFLEIERTPIIPGNVSLSLSVSVSYKIT